MSGPWPRTQTNGGRTCMQHLQHRALISRNQPKRAQTKIEVTRHHSLTRPSPDLRLSKWKNTHSVLLNLTFVSCRCLQSVRNNSLLPQPPIAAARSSYQCFFVFAPLPHRPNV